MTTTVGTLDGRSFAFVPDLRGVCEAKEVSGGGKCWNIGSGISFNPGGADVIPGIFEWESPPGLGDLL